MPKEGTVNYLWPSSSCNWQRQTPGRVGGVEKHFRGLGKEGGQDQQRSVRRERSPATRRGTNENKRQEGRKEREVGAGEEKVFEGALRKPEGRVKEEPEKNTELRAWRIPERKMR